MATSADVARNRRYWDGERADAHGEVARGQVARGPHGAGRVGAEVADGGDLEGTAGVMARLL